MDLRGGARQAREPRNGIDIDAERFFNLGVGGQKCSSSSQLIEWG
jgi:hypothetical protein